MIILILGAIFRRGINHGKRTGAGRPQEAGNYRDNMSKYNDLSKSEQAYRDYGACAQPQEQQEGG
jgi:hypothetical protein